LLTAGAVLVTESIEVRTPKLPRLCQLFAILNHLVGDGEPSRRHLDAEQRGRSVARAVSWRD
jgi:hypothetical protein